MSQGFVLSDYQRQIDEALSDAGSSRTAEFLIVQCAGRDVALRSEHFAAILPVSQAAVRFEVRHLACFCLHEGDEYAGLSLGSLLHEAPVVVSSSSRVLIPKSDVQGEAMKGVALVVDQVRGFASSAPDTAALVEIGQIQQYIQ